MLTEGDITALEASILKEDFHEFFQEFWPLIGQGQSLADNWHIHYLCKYLGQVGDRIVNRLPKMADVVINIPPSETKSSIISIAWPAWLLAKDPTTRIISGSYDGDLARELATKTRDILEDPRYQKLFPATRLRRDSKAKSYYVTTKGGGRRAVGSGSAITGRHANVIIVDDPIDPRGVRSEKVTASVNIWMEKTLPSRFIDKESGTMVLVMQRLSEGDPTDKMLKNSPRTHHICFPATDEYEIKPESARKYYKNGLMNPLRNTRESLKEIEKKLGPIDYPTQYGQSPGSFEGNMFLKKYFTILDKAPEGIYERPQFWAVDTNLKGSTGGDPIGTLRWTVHNGLIHITNFWSEAMSSPALLRRLEEEYETFAGKSSIMFIEPKASGPAITEMLQHTGTINVAQYAMPANAGKIDRAAAILPRLANQGCVLVDPRGTWAKAFVEKVSQFPNVINDEEIDCLTMAYDITYGTRISNARQWHIH